MTILIFRLMSAYRGGLHGEKTASHDGEKKQQQEGGTEGEAGTTKPEIGREEAFTVDRRRQSLPSTEDAYQSDSKDGGEGMTDSTSNLPKTGGHVARVLGQLTNDTRVTNLLMLVLVFIGMGGAEAAQTQLCSL